MFASWDAEEFGVIGSTEWVEDHAKELIENAVAYINVDTAVTGNVTLRALGSPLLKSVVYDVAKEVTYNNGSGEEKVFDIWKSAYVKNITKRFSYPR